jgi:hypothetical protein
MLFINIRNSKPVERRGRKAKDLQLLANAVMTARLPKIKSLHDLHEPG